MGAAQVDEQPAQVAGQDPGTRGQSLRGRDLRAVDELPGGLSLRGAHCALHHPPLPLQRQWAGLHLCGHPGRAAVLVARTHCGQTAVVAVGAPERCRSADRLQCGGRQSVSAPFIFL